MRSSTLYGPVTKVTAGEYFVQLANKGVDKKKKEEGSEVKDRRKKTGAADKSGKTGRNNGRFGV